MVSTLDVNSALYRLVNVPAINDVISGKVYIGSFPDGNQDENITINTLTNPNQYLQNGYMNLNVYVQEPSSGVPPLSRFKQIIDVLIPLVLDAQKDYTYFFQIDDDKGFFKDTDHDGMWFYNLRLEFQQHNNS
ncbi:hypothetical protein [Joostella sp.]|uniref:hypothetical protein n=1 Tax=Joostella sp. TaxID=2231138 RepID=UPI003A91A1FE